MNSTILIVLLWATKLNYMYFDATLPHTRIPPCFSDGISIATLQMHPNGVNVIYYTSPYERSPLISMEPNTIYDIEFDYLIPYGYSDGAKFKFMIDHYLDINNSYKILEPREFYLTEPGRWIHFSKGWRSSKETTSAYLRFGIRFPSPEDNLLGELHIKNFSIRKRGMPFDRP